MSFKGHSPEGDGILMGLLLLEMVAATNTPLDKMVEMLLAEVGPSYYARLDLRLKRPISKEESVKRMRDEAPQFIGSYKVSDISTLDGVKYSFEDDSWLLIRPSGTEPVLRVYAEAHSPEMVDALLTYVRSIAGTN